MDKVLHLPGSSTFKCKWLKASLLAGEGGENFKAGTGKSESRIAGTPSTLIGEKRY